MTGFHIRRERQHKNSERRSCRDRDRGRSDYLPAKGYQRLMGNPTKLGRNKEELVPRAITET